jgi:hypothetical protein
VDFRWNAGAVVALVGVALGLAGCVEFERPIKGKQVSDDEVQVRFKICDDISANCNPEPMARHRGDSETRVLIAIRAPRGTDMPTGFTPKNTEVLFSGSNSYSAEMNAKAFHKDSDKWHGYISEDISGNDKDKAKFKLVLGLPHDPGGSFKFRPAVGYVNGGQTDTVTCAEDPRNDFNDGDTEYVCVDDPDTKKELRKNIPVKLD